MGAVAAGYMKALRGAVMILALGAGLGIVGMMLVTCADVILRCFGHAITGAVDIVKILGAVTLCCALPYTTACKGHVAVEYFFHKLGRRGRVLVDSMARILAIGLFALLTWQSMKYGESLRRSGEVTPTLQWPTFWVCHLLGVCCAVVVLIKLYHLFHPGKEMIKP